jgi:hypothetical protein
MQALCFASLDEMHFWRLSLQAFPLNETQAASVPAVAGTVAAEMKATGGDAVLAKLAAPEAAARLGYCSLQLADVCSLQLST